jgi:hypothetical protein
MARDEKIVRKMKGSKRNIRFADLDGFLKRQGFEVKQPGKGSSHYVYKRGEGAEKIRFTIVRPHGKKKTVDPAAVEEVLERLDLKDDEEEE